jgi:hypothetical protein
MKNKPVLDGKITDDKVFLKIFWRIGKNAEVLYKNWDKISEEFRKNEGRLSDVDLPNNILSALTY